MKVIKPSRRGKRTSCVATIVVAVAVAARAVNAELRRIQVGTLTCSLSASIGLVVGSQRNVSCMFRGTSGEPDEVRDAIRALTDKWRRWEHDIGFGIGIAHGFATLGTIGFEGRFDYAAIGTVSNVASRLCDEAKPGQILISPRVLTKVDNEVKVEPAGEFELKGIRRSLAAYNVLGALSHEPE